MESEILFQFRGYYFVVVMSINRTCLCLVSKGLWSYCNCCVCMVWNKAVNLTGMFELYGPKKWNSLPRTTQRIHSVFLFKTSIMASIISSLPINLPTSPYFSPFFFPALLHLLHMARHYQLAACTVTFLSLSPTYSQ